MISEFYENFLDSVELIQYLQIKSIIKSNYSLQTSFIYSTLNNRNICLFDSYASTISKKLEIALQI